MRIERPRTFDRFGALLINDLQKVYQLDSAVARGEVSQRGAIAHIPGDVLDRIESQMVVIVPVRNERLRLVEGVLTGIPGNCQVIVVSNTDRSPFNRFSVEVDAIHNHARFLDKTITVVHQRDPLVGQAFAEAGYTHLLDEEGLVRHGKAEGMIVGTMLATMTGRKYIGFVDADNYFPGAVHEYVREYAAGFAIARGPYAMVRIAWHSKPKVMTGQDRLFFAKWGRVSAHTNVFLNKLIAHYTGYETEMVKTGNAGEHAMSLDLALRMGYSPGYSIEPYHYIDLMERYGGVLRDLAEASDLGEGRIEIYQIESRNPHLHEVKGEDHVDDMIRAMLGVLYHSRLTPEVLKTDLLAFAREQNLIGKEGSIPAPLYYPPLKEMDCNRFREVLKAAPYFEELVSSEN